MACLCIAFAIITQIATVIYDIHVYLQFNKCLMHSSCSLRKLPRATTNVQKNKSYVGLFISYVGLIKSYVGLYNSYVGLYNSYVGDKIS